MRTLLIFPYLVLALTLFFGLIRLFIFVINKTRHKLQTTKSISNLNKDFHNFALKTKIKRWGLTTWIALTVFSAFIVIGWRVNSAIMEKISLKPSNTLPLFSPLPPQMLLIVIRLSMIMAYLVLIFIQILIKILMVITCPGNLIIFPLMFRMLGA